MDSMSESQRGVRVFEAYPGSGFARMTLFGRLEFSMKPKNSQCDTEAVSNHNMRIVANNDNYNYYESSVEACLMLLKNQKHQEQQHRRILTAWCGIMAAWTAAK